MQSAGNGAMPPEGVRRCHDNQTHEDVMASFNQRRQTFEYNGNYASNCAKEGLIWEMRMCSYSYFCFTLSLDLFILYMFNFGFIIQGSSRLHSILLVHFLGGDVNIAYALI